MSIKLTATNALLLLIFSTGTFTQVAPATSKQVAYVGGRSTPLQAVLNIAVADRQPIGIVFGGKRTLCGEDREYNFSGMSTTQALANAVENTGFKISTSFGVIRLVADDLDVREREVYEFRFDQFSAPPTSIAELSDRLGGYILSVIEGAGGFVFNTVVKPDEEIVVVPNMLNVTAPEVADKIVSLGSKGVWIMYERNKLSGSKHGATAIKIYGYHDSLRSIMDISCPESPR